MRNQTLRKPVRGSGLILQLFVFVYLPLTALLLVIAFGSLALHQSAMRSMVTDRDERAVLTAASALHAQLEHRLLEIEGLAARSADTPIQRLPEVTNNSGYLLASFPGGLGLFNRDGQALATTENQEMLHFSRSPDSSVFLSQLSPGETALRPVFSQPANGELAYLAAAASRNSHLAVGIFFPRQLAGEILEQAFSPDDHTSVYILDAYQNIIYSKNTQMPAGEMAMHPGIIQALRGESGAMYAQIGAQEQIVAYSPIQPVGWALVVQEAAEMVETPLLSSTLTAPLVLAPALLIAMLALFFGARQVVRPLQALEQQAARLAWGDFQAVQEPVGGIAEIRSLQAGLVHLAEKVKAAQESLHSYIGAITAGQEEERRRLSRELHDDTLQGMIALKQRIQLFQISIGGDSVSQSLSEIESLTEQVIQDLRRVTRALRPTYLEDLGLPAALEMLAQESGQALGLSVTFQKIGRERRQNPDTELAFYRIAQEALNNAGRHAQAKKVSVAIRYAQDAVVLEVTDDGVGFSVPKSPAEFAPGGHFGLLGMHERAELIGARLSIRSSSAQGTHLTITLPDRAESG
jgi:signal transduction histidine kinase